MQPKTLMSFEEFDRLEEPPELVYELDEGELVEMTKPFYDPHNRIARAIDRCLLAYVARNPIGDVLNSDNMFLLGPATARIPDLSFLTNERIKQIEAGKHIQGAPDLAIEVLSPSDTVAAMRRKVKQYFASGAKAVWLVYPESREIEVWQSAAGSKVVLGEDDLLELPDLLPGFSARVGSFF